MKFEIEIPEEKMKEMIGKSVEGYLNKKGLLRMIRAITWDSLSKLKLKGRLEDHSRILINLGGRITRLEKKGGEK